MTQSCSFEPAGLKCPEAGNSVQANLASLGFEVGSRPLRDWKPGKPWVARDGIFPKSPKCRNSHASFESRLEALAHLHLSIDCRIREYVCQPKVLTYWMPDAEGGESPHEYTPDFVALTRTGDLLVIDAKAKWFREREYWRQRENFIRDACRAQWRAGFLIWTEAELMAEPRLSNARTLYRHRFAPRDKSLEFAVRAVVSRSPGGISIAEICRTISQSACVGEPQCFSAIMRLALTHEVSICQDQKIGRSSLVRLVEASDD